MDKPDDNVTKGLEAIGATLSQAPVNLEYLKVSVVRLLEYLSSPEGRTDANCRAVDSCFCLTETGASLNLPPDFQSLFDDIGGALHDAVSHPDIAKNFESTPEQLLTRAKELTTEQAN